MRLLAYVNHLRADVLDVIDVASHKILQRVAVPSDAGGSSDEAISPDGKEIWLGMPNNGKTTTIVNAQTYRVAAILDTGPRTNHPNFVTVDGVDYAYLTVGDLSQTLIYRRSTTGEAPTLVKTIANHGKGSHGLWPSPDNTRMYVALQYSDAVDVIDTKTMEVINTLRVGQSPMAAVYVARSAPGSTANLSQQGLGMRVENRPIELQGVPGAGNAQIRALPGVDEVAIDVRGLPRTAHSPPMRVDLPIAGCAVTHRALSAARPHRNRTDARETRESGLIGEACDIRSLADDLCRHEWAAPR